MIKGYQVPGTTNGASAVRCVYLNNGATLSGFTLSSGATANFDYGGGVKCASTNCLVTNCVIVGNASYDGGAGAFNGTLKNCALIGNSAPPLNIGSGGGANSSVLVNCLLARNFAGYVGGGAINSTLINCTVVSNVSAAYGGSVWGSTLQNCIVYYNSSYYTNADSNPGYSFSNCCLSFSPSSGANNFTNPPLFANLSASDYHLSAASPCINAGNNSSLTDVTDLDGNPRIVGGIVDVGAYEFQSAVHYVKTPVVAATPVSPFTNWVTAATNIQDAIDAANAGDFIVVSNGTYNTGGRVAFGSLTNRVAITRAVTVQSVNGPAVTIIQGHQVPGTITGDGAVRCVYLTNSAVLSGFTLTNGATLITSGDPKHDQVGGGAYCETYSSTISNCVLVGNAAYVWGGGAVYGTLNNCIIKRNSANSGGGTYFCKLSNCALVGNTVSGSGGGAARGSLNNCTISSNSAAMYGGGFDGSTDGTLNNCIVYFNNAPTNANYFRGSFNAYGSINYCCTVPFSTNGPGNITNDPVFVNAPAGDLHLQSSSPCINAGSNALITGSADLDGHPRIVGGTVDMGAYEFQSPDSVVFYANLPMPTNNLSGITVSWQSVNGVNYFIQRCGDLSAQPPFLTIQSNIVGLPGTTSYTDTSAIGDGPYFYRVGVQ